MQLHLHWPDEMPTPQARDTTQQARQELQPPDSLIPNDKNHHRVWSDDFEIIVKGFKSNFKRQISETLHIKEKAPDLNIQKDAFRFSLYN